MWTTVGVDIGVENCHGYHDVTSVDYCGVVVVCVNIVVVCVNIGRCHGYHEVTSVDYCRCRCCLCQHRCGQHRCHGS